MVEKGVTTWKLAKRHKESQSAVVETIKRFGEHFTIKDLPGRGRKRGPSDPELDKKICSLFAKNRSVSIRDAAKNLGCTSSMVKLIKGRHGLDSYRKGKVSKRSIEQEGRARSRVKLLTRKLRNFQGCIKMDDKTYVKLDYRSLPGTQFYSARKGEVLNK
jgi:hypothetical protein